MAEERKSQAHKEYDALAKNLLAHKEVIANILKYAVREFRNCSIKEIISCLNGNPEIATEPVDDEYPPKMDIAGSETVSASEGTRTYDIKFKVKLPNKDEEIELIINIEAQSSSHPGYIIEKRGVYYLCRMISSQYNVEFKNSDFNKLKKVYSIWICTHSPKKIANTITRYSLKPECVVGNVPDCPKNYDLMELVMINLGESDENYDGLIKMLDTLLNKYIDDRDKALTILENEYSIPFKSINEEVDSMCNLSQGIYDRGKAEGAIEGKIQGIIEQSLKVVENLLKKGSTLDEALEIAEIDKETYEKYNSKS
ncbi:MAG: hypothetical protein NC177_14030 [Ruminococcus flavefaciens]|nr:hypothetical protein [Ruminococcus flavefaciens]